MDEPLAVALKFGFLAVLYLFLLWVVRSSAARPGPVQRQRRGRARRGAGPGTAPRAPRPSGAAARLLA